MRRKRSLGISFVDEIAKVTARSGHFKPSTGEESWKEWLLPNYLPEEISSEGNIWRVTALFCITLAIFFVLFLRLFHLQIVKGAENRQLADGNRIQIRVAHAPRGVIFDRNGVILAQNNPGFRLEKAHISRDEALEMEALSDTRFNNLEIDSIRSYSLALKTAHVLGYVSEITAEELKDHKYKGYLPGDPVGRGGVEETYEKSLRGVDGGEVIEVDAGGRKIRSLRQKEPTPGQNLYLTIDAGLQAVVYDQLVEQVKKVGSCCGAAVAIEPTSGQILSLVSVPSFDPTNVASFLTADNSPLLNRVISGTYPPGSTFKIASALAGLESGKVTPSTQFEDTGIINLGPYTFSNWYYSQYGRTDGQVDIIKALQRSNDIFFYRLGQAVGENIMGETAKKMGMNRKLGIDISGEVTGLIPDNNWKIKNTGESWYPGDSLHMAIGQGFVLATPLQVSNLVSMVAAGGKEYKPHLAWKITDSSQKVVREFKSESTPNQFKTENLDMVRKGLLQVPLSGGTAWPFFTFPIPTAGKTGTAEYGDPKNRTHAWYTSYAPLDNPKIAVTVLVEGGGGGSDVAAPVAKEIYRWYFSPDKKNLIKDTNTQATDSGQTLGE